MSRSDTLSRDDGNLDPILEDLGIALADLQVEQRLLSYRQFSSRTPIHARVRRAILHCLAAGACSNQAVARDLNLHIRTLHRKLRLEGRSFQQIKDDVRRELAHFYLQTDLGLGEISERLGFSEQSVLSRHCNRWWGVSPTQHRRELRVTGISPCCAIGPQVPIQCSLSADGDRAR